MVGLTMNTILASEEGLSRLFDLDMQLLSDSVLTLIAVFVLFLVASNFLFNPVRKMMNDRTEKIKADLENSEQELSVAKEQREKYEELMKNVHKESEEILAEARKRGMDNEARIVAEAKEEAARIIDRARTEAELEKKKMADEVKREMVAIASLMASKVVADNIDTSIQYELIEQTLKEIGDSTWQS